MRPRLAIAAGAGFLLLAISAAPLIPALYLAFAVVCHQIPERCFHWHGLLLPVCARCLGLYAGALAAAVRPIRVSTRLLWILAAANGLEFLSGAGSLEPRFALAAVFCWCGVSHLIALAPSRTAASN